MAWTFTGNIQRVQHLGALAAVANSKDVLNRRHVRALVGRMEELLEFNDDLKAVTAFVGTCGHMDLNVRVVELYVKKHGVQNIEILNQIISMVRYWSHSQNRAIIDHIFSQTPQAFHLSHDIDDTELETVIRLFSRVYVILVSMYEEYYVLPGKIREEITLFTAVICDTVVHKARNGADPGRFLADADANAPLFTDMMISIFLTEDLPFDLVRGCFRFLDIEAPNDSAPRSAFKAVRDVFVARAVKENVDLTFDEICIAAANIFDFAQDGIATAIDEEFVITEGLPLCASDDDVLRLCRSFGTKTGTNRCISTYLAQCETLDRWMLAELAASVPSMHAFGGLSVRKDLVAAKERFALVLDLEKVFEQSERKMRVDHFFACARRIF